MQVIVISCILIVVLALLVTSSILSTYYLYKLSNHSPNGEPAKIPLIREYKATKPRKTVYLTDKRENDKARQIAEGA